LLSVSLNGSCELAFSKLLSVLQQYPFEVVVFGGNRNKLKVIYNGDNALVQVFSLKQNVLIYLFYNMSMGYIVLVRTDDTIHTEVSVIKIGRASVGKECRDRWCHYLYKQRC